MYMCVFVCVEEILKLFNCRVKLKEFLIFNGKKNNKYEITKHHNFPIIQVQE